MFHKLLLALPFFSLTFLVLTSPSEQRGAAQYSSTINIKEHSHKCNNS